MLRKDLRQCQFSSSLWELRSNSKWIISASHTDLQQQQQQQELRYIGSGRRVNYSWLALPMAWQSNPLWGMDQIHHYTFNLSKIVVMCLVLPKINTCSPKVLFSQVSAHNWDRTRFAPCTYCWMYLVTELRQPFSSSSPERYWLQRPLQQSLWHIRISNVRDCTSVLQR